MRPKKLKQVRWGNQYEMPLAVRTLESVAAELGVSRPTVAKIEKQALAKVRAFIMLGLLSCSGPAFEGDYNEKGNDTTAAGGDGGEDSPGGGGPVQGSAGRPGMAGVSSAAGNAAGGASEAGASGATAMAGGTSMGEGGQGGVRSSGPAECLANWQNLDCARVCTDSQSDCQAVINCYVTTNSLDNCFNFTTIGVTLAQGAERNCCHD